MITGKFKLALIFSLAVLALACNKNRPQVIEEPDKGVIYVHSAGDSVKICLLADNIFRIIHHYNLIEDDSAKVPFVINNETIHHWKSKRSRKGIEISTKQMRIHIDRSGRITFYNNDGKQLTSELENSEGPRQSFSCGDEALYGLGQFQNGLLNLKNAPLRLKQFNQEIANPFMVSTAGYGILWNNTSVTDFNPPESVLEFETITDTIDNISETGFIPSETGNYHFAVESLSVKKNRFAGPVLLTFNGDTVIHYNTTWVPDYLSGEIYLEKDKNYRVVFMNKKADSPARVLYNKAGTDRTTFQSKSGKVDDYFFVEGAPNQVIAGYRKLTGAAPMFGKWAFGFWQCRERYHSQQELLENAREYRKRGIPLDNIVQDWNYWPKGTWGPQWNRELYPNPKRMCSELKNMNVHLMVSVWPRIKNQELEERYHLSKYKFGANDNLDMYSPEVRANYYEMLKDSMFDLGVSSIWLDGTEPETTPWGVQTTAGLFDDLALSYSFEVTRAVYEGHRKDFPNERMFNLTRSAFAGQQRFAAASWSGDVRASWEQLAEQITAGLNYSMSGLPYWTTDIGGFFRDKRSLNPTYRDQYTDKNYIELLTRWFQFGTFCPLFRIHGYVSNTEIWRYGAEFEKTAREFINLRYRLMPYIYSTASEVTFHDEIMMKPLAYNYPDDKNCWDVKDQFLFGNSMMVCPVIHKGERKRDVYLPEGEWYNFWDGKKSVGETTVTVETPLEKMPVFVKAGSVIPIGTNVQYAMENKGDTLQILVYPGADGSLKLYEDEGENYNYEKGEYSIIRIAWNEKKSTLTLGKRKGEYKGMVKEKFLQIVLVAEGAVNWPDRQNINKEIMYNGEEVQIKIE